MIDAIFPHDLWFDLVIISGVNFNTKVGTYKINSQDARVFQEIVDGNVLTKSGNRLRAKVWAGSGTLQVSDIVLWYQSNV
jgi:hypothetical protein